MSLLSPCRALALLAPMLCGSSISNDMKYILDRHNAYRCLHGVPLVSWDAQVAASAQAWADAATSFTHAGSSSQYYSYGSACGCGENLAGTSSSDPKTAVDQWYSEFTSYQQWDLDHFTAMIWKDVSSMGCGVRVGGPAWTSGALVVCRYKSASGGVAPNAAGGAASSQVSLTTSGTLSSCEATATAFGTASTSSSDDDDDGMSTTLIIICCVCGALVLACLFTIIIMRCSRRRTAATAASEQAKPDPSTSGAVKQEVSDAKEPVSDVRETATAEKNEKAAVPPSETTKDVEATDFVAKKEKEDGDLQGEGDEYAKPDDNVQANGKPELEAEKGKTEPEPEAEKDKPVMAAMTFEQAAPPDDAANTQAEPVTTEASVQILQNSARPPPTLESARNKQFCGCACDGRS